MPITKPATAGQGACTTGKPPGNSTLKPSVVSALA